MKKWITALGMMLCLATTPAFAQESIQTLVDRGDFAAAFTQLGPLTTPENEPEVVAEALALLAQISLATDNLDNARLFSSLLDGKLDDREFVSKLKHGKKSGWFVVSAWVSSRINVADEKFREARSDIYRALNAAREANVNAKWEGVLRYELAKMLTTVNQKDAREAAEEAISVTKKTGDKVIQAYANLLLGNLELARAKTKRAIDHYADAIELIRAAGTKYDIAYIHLSIAEKQSKTGETKYTPEAVKADIQAAGNPADLLERLKNLTPAT